MLNVHGPSAFQRAVRRGLQAALRGGFRSTTLLLLVGVLTLLQLLAASVVGAQAVHGMLTSRSALYLEVLPTASDQDVQELYAAIQELPYVRDVAFIPSEKAYELERTRTPDLVNFLEQYDVANPFPDSFSVTLESLSDYDAFSSFVSNPQWSAVIDPSFLSSVTGQERDVRQLAGIASAIRMLLLLLTLVGSIVLFFLLAEIVARKARRHEGELMLESLLGGKPSDALVPVIVELSCLALAALIVGTLLASLLLYLVSLAVPVLSGLGNLGELLGAVTALFLRVGLPVFVLECVAIVAIVTASTVVGVRPRMLWPAPTRA